MAFETNLTEGSVAKKYIFFVIPILLSGFMQQLYNSADAVVVGKFVGDTALAAVGATSSLTNLILNLFLGLSVGTNVVCSRFFGAGDKEALHKAIHTSILLGIISGVLLALVGLIFSGSLLRFMATPEEVIGEATLYMQIYFLGAPASMLYNFGAAVLRAAGDTKRPLYILAAAGVANVVLNLFCVIVLELGVLGVAIGTVASQLLSAVMVLWILVRNNTEFKLTFSKLRIYKNELIKIAATGIPAGLNGIMFNISNVIIQTAINSFGKVAMAGSVASGNIENFVFLVINSAEQGVITFVGQNMGAKKPKRVNMVIKTGLLSTLVGVGVLSALVIIFSEELLGLFVKDASQTGIIKVGVMKMAVVVSSYCLLVPSSTYGAALKGMGSALACMVVNSVCVCLTRIVWILAILPLKRTITMLFFAYPVSWAISSIVMFVVYIIIRKKRYERIGQIVTTEG